MTPTNRRRVARSTTVTTPTAPTTTTGKGKHKHHRPRDAYVPPASAKMVADTSDGISQAAHLGNPGLPIYYPKYIPGDYAYCFSLTGNCNIGYEPAAGLRRLISAALLDRRHRRQALPVLRDDARRSRRAARQTPATATSPRSRARPGGRRPRGRPADPAQANRREDRQQQAALRVLAGRHADARRLADAARPCTGSPTRSRTRSPTIRCSRWRPRSPARAELCTCRGPGVPQPHPSR